MSTALRCLSLAVAAVLALSCRGRGHDLEEGLYALTAQSVIRDDCNRLAGESALFTGEVVLSGDIIRIKRALYGMQLVGAYLAGQESFKVDGSVGNIAETLDGAACLLDLVTVHLDATTGSPTSFRGTARIRFDGETEACTCEVWATYQAVKQ